MNPLMKNILLLLALLTFVSCSKEEPLLIKIKTAVDNSEQSEAGYEVLDISEITDFDWDTLYHFHQLDEKNYISRVIGFKWTGDEVPNLHRRLLFVNKGEVVKYIDYEFSELPFTLYGCGEDRWVYPRDRAVFATFKFCAGEDTTYPMIPVACLSNFQTMIDAECPEQEVSE
jgi:hypothetical protein